MYSVSDADTLQRMCIAGSEFGRLLWEGPAFLQWLAGTEEWTSLMRQAASRDWQTSQEWLPPMRVPETAYLSFPADAVDQLFEVLRTGRENSLHDDVRGQAIRHFLITPLVSACLISTFDELHRSIAAHAAERFVVDHGLPVEMTPWITELVRLLVVQQTLPSEATAALPTTPSLSQPMLDFEGHQDWFVFEPPALAIPSQLEDSIAEFMRETRHELELKYLGTRPRALEKQSEITERYTQRFYRSAVVHRTATEISEEESVAGDASYSPSAEAIRDSISLCRKWLSGKRSHSGKR